VKGAAIDVGHAGIEAGLESAANRIDIARACGGKDALVGRSRVDPVDMGLELPPAREPIVVRDRELSAASLASG
jgi:hypothetical protein